MASIKNIEGLSDAEILSEIRNGGKFVVFEYTVSIVVMTFKRGSNIYFIRSGESTAGKSAGFTITTFLLGWWGIPWGPVYSIGSLVTNFSGGKNVTQEILAHMGNRADEPVYETLRD